MHEIHTLMEGFAAYTDVDELSVAQSADAPATIWTTIASSQACAASIASVVGSAAYTIKTGC